jgi:HAD superfamily hydrolase (TIGR01509 family)
VASSSSHEKLRLTLGLTGLWTRFEGHIYSAYEVEHGKPAPDLFLHAAAREGFEPGDCIVIEDSPAGVAAAHAADMRVLHYGQDFTDMRKLPDLL